MRTLADWINAHPEVDSSQFEKNYSKESGSGDYEYTCGFCLASHFDGKRGPENCAFCGASFREAESISDLPEITGQVWRLVDEDLPKEIDYVLLQIAARHLVIVGIRMSPEGFFKTFFHFQVSGAISDPDEFDPDTPQFPVYVLIGPLDFGGL